MAFTVTYNGNGSDGGSVPVDPKSYNAGNMVNVLPVLEGSLTKTGAVFAYWNTQFDGNGAIYGWPQVAPLSMPAANVVLYAQWFVTTGLTNGGATTHYRFFYDSTLQAKGIEPRRIEALIQKPEVGIPKVEVDYAIMAEWFTDVTPSLPSRRVFVTRLTGGANNNGDIRLKPRSNNPDELRSLLVSEVTESFMHGQGKGWGFLPGPGADNENSCGEALSLFLTQQFELLQRITGPYTDFTANGWLNSSLPASDPNSTRKVTNPDKSVTDFGSRFDYVNSTLPYPGNGPGTGCSILFIYYLFHRLSFTIEEIIAAAPGFTNGNLNATAPLQGVYRNLTGDGGNPFPFFKFLLDEAFPPNLTASIPGANPDDPWPLRGWLHNRPSNAPGPAVPVAAGTNPTSWYTTSDNVEHIAYVGDDQKIHELYYFIGGSGGWLYNRPSNAPGPVVPVAAGTNPTSWYTTSDNVEHIAYVGDDQKIHELYYFIR
ncbi:MAG: InlB B-repeat-containing protein [Acidobacteriaceae bacterium]